MKDLLKEIQKLLPLSSTPKRMLYPCPPGSPTGTLYEMIGEVKLVSASQASAGPSQPARTSKPVESGSGEDPYAGIDPLIPSVTKAYRMVSQIQTWAVTESKSGQDIRVIQNIGEGQNSRKDEDAGSDEDFGSE